MSIEEQISELIDKYENETDRSQSEADLRAGYVDQLFFTLGWNIHNDPGQLTNYRREGYIRGVGYVDVGLEITGQPVLMLEAKKFGVLTHSAERTYDRTPEEKQLFRYARGKKIPYCILTNFERLHVFNADHERLISAFDDPAEYLARLSELLRLSPERVKSGSLPASERQIEIKDIDEAFLASLQGWRTLLANAIYQDNLTNTAMQTNGEFDFGKLMAAVQRILDRLILIRYGDDKEVLLKYDVIEDMLSSYHRKASYARPDDLMRELVDFSHRMDDHHNTTLFQPGHICEQVFIPNEVLEKIMTEMNNISFRKFTSDILGNTYETYLGTKLALRNGEIKSEERRDIRKAEGIFYTPTMVVHYIVDNTLGQLLKELESQHGLHAIEKAEEIRVLDPACGSGSFLIYAYQVLADFYRRMNEAIENEQVKLLASVSSTDMFQRLELFKQLPQPLINYPHHILEDQLYGVDIDPEAAEIAAVNLTMQAFADAKREKLPLILNENIKVGNSLISGKEEELRRYFGDDWQDKKPFNWEEEFKDIMANGGFDVVIGNPPWVSLTGPRSKAIGKEDVPFFKNSFVVASDPIIDTYALFVEKATSLLRPSGVLGFILPDIVLLKNYPTVRKYILDSYCISEIIHVGRAFKTVNLDAAIVILQKENDGESRRQNLIKVVTNGETYFQGIQGEDHVSQAQFEAAPKYKFNIYLSGDKASLKAKLDKQSFRLGEGWECHEGIHSGNIRHKLFIDASATPLDYPLIFGRDEIAPYLLDWAGKWVRYDPSIIDTSAGEYAGLGRKEHFTVEKLVIRRTGDRVLAAYDDEGVFVSNNMFVLIARKESSFSAYELKFILALLNSKLMTTYFRLIQPRVGRLFAELKIEHLGEFPIRRIDFDNPKDKKLHDDLVALVSRMLELNKRLAPIRNTSSGEREELLREVKRTDAEIDQKVYELYGLTEEERQIVEASAGKS